MGLLVGGAAWAARRGHAGDRESAGSRGGDGEAPANQADLTSLVARMSTQPVIETQALGPGGEPSNRAGRVKAAAVALAVLSVVGTVAGERAIHRWGEGLTRVASGARTRGSGWWPVWRRASPPGCSPAD